MRASTSISERRAVRVLAALALFAALTPLAPCAATAADANQAARVEEEDFSETPFTEYGEFNEEEEEAADTKFFQFGRFFGVSIGTGFQGVTGNRGLLYQGGFPMVDFKFHYWFDFNLALDLNLTTATQFYEDTSATAAGHVDVNMLRVGVDFKYYFDTKNIAAPISFANPYLLFGAGSISKTEVSGAQVSITPDSSFALTAGGGLEFVVSPRKTYFELESKIHFPSFLDSYTTLYRSQGIDDLTGFFYTITGSLLFTW